MTALPLSKKVILLLDRRPEMPASGQPVRRYRIARLQFEHPGTDPDHRFDYLARTYD